MNFNTVETRVRFKIICAQVLEKEGELLQEQLIAACRENVSAKVRGIKLEDLEDESEGHEKLCGFLDDHQDGDRIIIMLDKSLIRMLEEQAGGIDILAKLKGLLKKYKDNMLGLSFLNQNSGVSFLKRFKSCGLNITETAGSSDETCKIVLTKTVSCYADPNDPLAAPCSLDTASLHGTTGEYSGVGDLKSEFLASVPSLNTLSLRSANSRDEPFRDEILKQNADPLAAPCSLDTASLHRNTEEYGGMGDHTSRKQSLLSVNSGTTKAQQESGDDPYSCQGPQTKNLKYPVTLDIDEDDELSTEDLKKLPENLREDFYDVMILYHDNDRKQATIFCDHLKNKIPMDKGYKIKAVLYDHLGSGNNRIIGKLQFAMERCTYVFMFVTADFISDGLKEFEREECIMQTIHSPEKKWCAIPVFTESRSDANYTIPMGLMSFKGLNYWADDDFYKDAVKKIIMDKIYMREQKEEKLKYSRKASLITIKRQELIEKKIQQERLKSAIEKNVILEKECIKNKDYDDESTFSAGKLAKINSTNEQEFSGVYNSQQMINGLPQYLSHQSSNSLESTNEQLDLLGANQNLTASGYLPPNTQTSAYRASSQSSVNTSRLTGVDCQSSDRSISTDSSEKCQASMGNRPPLHGDVVEDADQSDYDTKLQCKDIRDEIKNDDKPEKERPGESDPQANLLPGEIKEVHHHYYHNADPSQAEPKVINIIGASSVHIGDGTHISASELPDEENSNPASLDPSLTVPSLTVPVQESMDPTKDCTDAFCGHSVDGPAINVLTKDDVCSNTVDSTEIDLLGSKVMVEKEQKKTSKPVAVIHPVIPVCSPQSSENSDIQQPDNMDNPDSQVGSSHSESVGASSELQERILIHNQDHSLPNLSVHQEEGDIASGITTVGGNLNAASSTTMHNWNSLTSSSEQESQRLASAGSNNTSLKEVAAENITNAGSVMVQNVPRDESESSSSGCRENVTGPIANDSLHDSHDAGSSVDQPFESIQSTEFVSCFSSVTHSAPQPSLETDGPSKSIDAGDIHVTNGLYEASSKAGDKGIEWSISAEELMPSQRGRQSPDHKDDAKSSTPKKGKKKKDSNHTGSQSSRCFVM